jgi:hypothetical protein
LGIGIRASTIRRSRIGFSKHLLSLNKRFGERENEWGKNQSTRPITTPGLQKRFRTRVQESLGWLGIRETRNERKIQANASDLRERDRQRFITILNHVFHLRN